jgi:predicted secreted protein
MDWFTGIATFLTIWWVVLFAILPIGVRSQLETGEVAPGSEPGAPAAPMLKKKLVWTTAAAGGVWALLALAIEFNLFAGVF